MLIGVSTIRNEEGRRTYQSQAGAMGFISTVATTKAIYVRAHTLQYARLDKSSIQTFLSVIALGPLLRGPIEIRGNNRPTFLYEDNFQSGLHIHNTTLMKVPSRDTFGAGGLEKVVYRLEFHFFLPRIRNIF